MAPSADLITLIVNGTFSILPNRTIAIDRPNIDPSSIPAPVKTSPMSSPTSTFLVAPAPSQNLNDDLRTGLLAGLLAPIVLSIITTLIVRFRTFRLAKKYGIAFSFLFSWREITPRPAPPLTSSTCVLPMSTTAPPPVTAPQAPTPTLPQSNPPSSNVATRVNARGETEFYCINHGSKLDPETWICETSGDIVDPQFRSKTKPDVEGLKSGAGASGAVASRASMALYEDD